MCLNPTKMKHHLLTIILLFIAFAANAQIADTIRISDTSMVSDTMVKGDTAIVITHTIITVTDTIIITPEPPPPPPQYWKTGKLFQANFTQAAFFNWTQGGENNISIAGMLELFAHHEKGNYIWANDLRLGYGRIRTGELTRKGDDQIHFATMLDKKITDQFSYNAQLDFRTQFDLGFKNPTDSVPISKFMAPAYVMAGIGINWHPEEWISINFAPVSGKFTYVGDTATIPPENYGIDDNKQLRSELGATARIGVRKDLMENVNIASDLELFSNYLHEPQNLDINWLMRINLRINKFLVTTITTHVLYDHDILIPKTNDQGEEYLGRGTQFKEVIAIGLTYKF